MRSFLQQIAHYYSATGRLEDFCFIFPNRRSGQFFEQKLKNTLPSTSLMPKVTTLTDFLIEAGDKMMVSPIDAIFTLYQAYAQVMGDGASTIDHFIYWGNILLNDFNDVDMSMANPKDIFTNLSDLRDISTDYIDADLKREIDRILNIQLSETNEFWKKSSHSTNASDGEIQQEYYTLWEQMPLIYETFHSLLETRGLTTMGHLYRNFASQSSLLEQKLKHYSKIVLVGFAGLSVSEDCIFKTFKLNSAHFWWDDCGDAFPGGKNAGIELVKQFKKRYPMPIELDGDYPTAPRMDVMGVPTLQGQAKWAMHLIDTMGKRQAGEPIDAKLGHLPGIDDSNAINTAIVLPDEQLFVPIISSVPVNLCTLNVTLGYSMRNSSISSLMHLIARVHRQASFNKTTGKWSYFRESVMDILSHPMLKSTFTADVLKLTATIENSSEYNIGEEVFADTALRDIFITIHDLHDKHEVLAFIDRIIGFVSRIDARVRITDATVTPNGSSSPLLPLQSAFNLQFITALEQLRKVLDENLHMPTEDITIFYLIDRITSGITIPFTGEPLQGLQVMGILETRCLDFDNIIIPSMNEHVYPSRRGISSLIPGVLREANMLPTNSSIEALNTYYFYRMISRAHYVAFIYDSSAQSYGSGEPSRFVNQLEKIYHHKLNYFAIDTHINISSALDIAVPKQEGLMSIFTTQEENKKYLSASAINSYIDCPLKFYFQRMQGLNGDLPGDDFMDAATFGTIVHDSLQAFYYPDINGKPRSGPYVVTADMINKFKKDRLSATVVREINKTYLHRPAHECDLPVYGDAYILQESLETYVVNALNKDLEYIDLYGDITILECEVEHTVNMEIEGIKFNFTFKIDRLDRIGDCIRLIDYKTGADSTKMTSVSALFDPHQKHRCHAILQLLLYCNAYCQKMKQPLKIIPMIYKLRNMAESGIFIKENKSVAQYEFTLDNPINLEFLKEMKVVISDMLNENKPFTQTGNTDNCSYCRFTDFCRR